VAARSERKEEDRFYMVYQSLIERAAQVMSKAAKK
jgi:hypothetical protein